MRGGAGLAVDMGDLDRWPTAGVRGSRQGA